MGKKECRYWLFQIMYDSYPQSWELMIQANIAAHHYPPGWVNESWNVTTLQKLKSGDLIVAAFKNHRFAAYGRLISDFYRDGPSLDVRTSNGEVFEFRERFDCEWTAIPPGNNPNFADCSDLRDSIDTRMMRGLCVKEIDEESFNAIKSRVDEAGAIKTTDFRLKMPMYTLEQCAEDTCLANDILDNWIKAIHRKGQAILFGPPGTGKTFLAEHLARHLISGGDGFVELVQFHPAYAYEDFIQGIRPQARLDGTLEYSVVPGRFLDFCRKAQEREGICVLIIDEINRANLSRVFGELMYLLEYRNKEIPLSVDGTAFQIPENVRIIGTMNTADRSIALVDHALRRRFAFIQLSPDFDILRRYHAKEGTDFPVEGLVSVLINLNKEIKDPHYELGISYFLRENLKEEIEGIWKMEIEPYLDEYFFDNRKSADKFRWDSIRSVLGF